MTKVDILVIGAGPAGMSAATEARRHGASVLLLDENGALGGQVHRAAKADATGPGGVQAREGAALMAGLRASGAEVRHGALLWSIEPGPRAFFLQDGTVEEVEAGRIILAGGATERALPVPGWTLPGVMGVGAAQILLKSAGLRPRGDVWIAGQGPLIWLYAAQVLAKGGELAGIIDMSRIAPRSLLHLPKAMRAPGYLLRGLSWMRAVRRRVPVLRTRDVEAEGQDRLESVLIDGRRHAADTLLLHDGVVPNTQVTRAIQGCEHRWNAAQRGWEPAVDAWGNTSVPGIIVAGDGGGIGGAAAAALSGRIAAMEACRGVGRFATERRDALTAPLLRRRRAELAPRAFLDALFTPLPMPTDEVILCRCEEVTAGRVREAAGLGCLGTNQLKAFTRAGMGLCQGRTCGPLLHATLAEARSAPGEAVDPLRTRFPTKPLTLGEMAALAAPGVTEQR
jgi:NADPH-dependent 2,4-dienoyl-CoA reductase/sulfur reductase-like enzyme